MSHKARKNSAVLTYTTVYRKYKANYVTFCNSLFNYHKLELEFCLYTLYLLF